MKAGASGHPVDLLSAWLDAELSTDESAVVRGHLEACDGCRRLVDEMRRVDAAAAGEVVPPVPADLASRIRSRLEASGEPGRVRAPWHRSRLGIPLALAAGTAGVLALWVAVRGFQGIPAPIQPPPQGTVAPVSPLPPAAPERAPDRQSPSVESGKVAAPGTGGAGGPSGPSGREGASAKPPPAPGIEEKKGVAGAQEMRKPAGRSVYAPAPPPPAPGAPAEPAPLGTGAARREKTAPSAVRKLAFSGAVALPRQIETTEGGFGIALSENGQLRVTSGGWVCSLDLGPAAGAGTLAKKDEEGPPAGSAGGEVAEIFHEVDRLTAAGAAGSPAAPSPGPQAKAPGAAPALRQGGIVLSGGGAPARVLSPEAADPARASEIESLAARIRRLALETHRDDLEKACGALPEDPGP